MAVGGQGPRRGGSISLGRQCDSSRPQGPVPKPILLEAPPSLAPVTTSAGQVQQVLLLQTHFHTARTSFTKKH